MYKTLPLALKFHDHTIIVIIFAMVITILIHTASTPDMLKPERLNCRFLPTSF